MDSISPDVTVNLMWVMGSGIVVLLGFVAGKALGKNVSLAQLQVLEERLTHKEAELQRQNNERKEANDRLEQMQDDIRDKDILLAEQNVRIVSTQEDHKQKLAFALGAKEQLKTRVSISSAGVIRRKK